MPARFEAAEALVVKQIARLEVEPIDALWRVVAALNRIEQA
jgi:hypothetical protein